MSSERTAPESSHHAAQTGSPPVPRRGGSGGIALVGAGLLLLAGLFWIGQPDPSDQQLRSILESNRESADRLAADLVASSPVAVRFQISDLDRDAQILARGLGASTILVRDDTVWFQFRTDTGLPIVRVSEPTKSLVRTNGQSIRDSSCTTDESFDFDPEGQFWLVCRVIDDAWSICLDRRD